MDDLELNGGEPPVTASKPHLNRRRLILGGLALGAWDTLESLETPAVAAEPLDSFNAMGLRAWYRGVNSLYQTTTPVKTAKSEGNPVGLWLDSSGNNLHLYQPNDAKRPTLTLIPPNGRRSIRFDAANGQFLQAASAADWSFLHTGPSTVIVLFKTKEIEPASAMTLAATGAAVPPEKGYQLAYLNAPTSPPKDGLSIKVSDGKVFAANCTQSLWAVNPQQWSTVVALHSFEGSTHDTHLKVDGVTSAQFVRTGSTTLTGVALPFTVGKDAAAARTSWFDGEISEILVFASRLTDAQQAYVLKYLYGQAKHPLVNLVRADGLYNAFPSIVKRNDGKLLVAYRKAVAHAASEGSIVTSIGNADGTIWSQERAFRPKITGLDSREPCFTRLQNGDLMVSYYVRDLNLQLTPPGNVFTQRSTNDGTSWGPVASVDLGFTRHNLASAPVVELANGTLLMPAFGRNTDDLFTSSRVSFSTDGGQTWGSPAEIANGPSSGIDFIEPNIIRLNSGNLLCLLRTNGAGGNFYKSFSNDGGLTWSSPAVAFLGTGAPRMIQMVSGRIICVFRSGLAQTGQHAALRWSMDDGATWTAEEQLIDATMLSMMYAGMAEISPGTLAIAYGVQQGVGQDFPVSDIRFRLRAEVDIARLQ